MAASKRKKREGHYYGLREIAKVMGTSSFGVRRSIAKYGFPAFMRPSDNAAGGYGYCWYTNDYFINRWAQQQIEQSRGRLHASATGKRLAYTRGHPADTAVNQFTTDDGSWVDPPISSDDDLP